MNSSKNKINLLIKKEQKTNVNKNYSNAFKSKINIKTQLKESSVIINSPNSLLSNKNNKSKKYKRNIYDGKIKNKDWKKFKKNNQYNSPKNNLYSNNLYSENLNKINPSSPNSSFPLHLIKEILLPNNYKGDFKSLVDGKKITEFCILNDNKKSKYYIIEDNNIINYSGKWEVLRGVCSKCAVKFANTGIKCEEIIQNLVELRKNRLYSFDNYYKNLKLLLSKNQKQLNIFLKDLQNKKDIQVNLINDIFNDVKCSLDKLNNNISNNINNKYNNEINKIKEIINNNSENNIEIDEYKNDIKKNQEIIIKLNFDQKDFEKIIGNYESRLNKIININENLNLNSHIPIIQKGKYGKILKNLKNNLFNYLSDELIFNKNNLNKSLNINNISLVESEYNANIDNDLIISFDEKKYKTQVVNDKNLNNIRENNTNDHKYYTILNKISSSQINKNNFYSSFIKNNNNNEVEDISNKENEFIFIADNKNWEEKQTPQLGEKDDISDNILYNKSKCHKKWFN